MYRNILEIVHKVKICLHRYLFCLRHSQEVRAFGARPESTRNDRIVHAMAERQIDVVGILVDSSTAS